MQFANDLKLFGLFVAFTKLNYLYIHFIRMKKKGTSIRPSVYHFWSFFSGTSRAIKLKLLPNTIIGIGTTQVFYICQSNLIWSKLALCYVSSFKVEGVFKSLKPKLRYLLPANHKKCLPRSSSKSTRKSLECFKLFFFVSSTIVLVVIVAVQHLYGYSLLVS